MAGDSSSKPVHHQWTPEEDALLVQCLQELRDDGILVGDNGFKSGGLKKVQKLLEEKSPGCGLLGNRHITSHLKTLKASWSIVYDMLCGANTSEFRWDPNKQCVTAEKPVWDKYIKSHKKAAQFRGKSFPLFDVLCNVFGKDRATGREAINYADVTDDNGGGMPDANVDEVDDDEDFEFEIDPSIAILEGPSQNTNGGTSSSRKRRRTSGDHDEIASDVVKEMLTAISQDIKDSSNHLASHSDKLAREAMLDAQRETLYSELMKVEEFTEDEHTNAYLKMVADDKVLVGFPSLPDKAKATVVRKILANINV